MKQKRKIHTDKHKPVCRNTIQRTLKTTCLSVLITGIWLIAWYRALYWC